MYAAFYREVLLPEIEEKSKNKFKNVIKQIQSFPIIKQRESAFNKAYILLVHKFKPPIKEKLPLPGINEEINEENYLVDLTPHL